MILRTLQKPLPLQKLEVILPRVPGNYPRRQEMEKDLAYRMKGHIGEKKVSNYLKMLPSRYMILQDVTLQFNGHQFQIDNIITSQQAVFLIDSKNFEGKVIFDTILKQFIRNDGNVDKGYRYPITQMKTQKFQLQNWLQEHNFYNIPIYYFVVIADPSTVIDVVGDRQSIAKVVTHAENLPQRIMQLDEELKMNQTPRIDPHQIGQAILGECQDFDKDIMALYGINLSHLKPGVQCPVCDYIRMVWKNRSWFCPKCKKTSRLAHKKILYQYSLLRNSAITNLQASYLLQIKSRHQVKRQLKSARLQYNSKLRGWVFPKSN